MRLARLGEAIPRALRIVFRACHALAQRANADPATTGRMQVSAEIFRPPRPVPRWYLARSARAPHTKSKHTDVRHWQKMSPSGSAEAAAGMEAASGVEAASACGSVFTATIGPPAASPTGAGPEFALLGAASPAQACIERVVLGSASAAHACSCAGPMMPHWVKSSIVSAPYMPWQKAVKPICACGIVENSRAASTSNISNLSVLPRAPRAPPRRTKTMTSRERPARGTRLEPTNSRA